MGSASTRYIDLTKFERAAPQIKSALDDCMLLINNLKSELALIKTGGNNTAVGAISSAVLVNASSTNAGDQTLPTDATIEIVDITTNNASTTKHGWLVKATSPAANDLNVVGIANGETVYSDKTILSTTVPSTQSFSDSALAGTNLDAAHSDHKHAMPANPKDTTAITGILKGNGSAISAASAGTDYVAPNASITGATKTKITYDAKGLVTGGADTTTADIADSTDRRYVTDAEEAILDNTSGVNTGDETASGIESKLGVSAGNVSALANLSGTNTGDQTLAGLGGVPTSRKINGYDLTADRNLTYTDVGADAAGAAAAITLSGLGGLTQAQIFARMD
jgi:hypothetical protein